MFYEIKIKGHVRVPPKLFSEDVKEAILKRLSDAYSNYTSNKVGIVIAVSGIENIKDGVIIPGDGAAYYETVYKLFTFKPELQEVVLGKITDITDFGAFIDIGPIDGMIHISQTMDDFVSFSKSGSLAGRDTKKALKVNDKCRARIVAISYKEENNPKIGLTMRQPWLGNLNWVEDDIRKREKEEIKELKKEEKKKK